MSDITPKPKIKHWDRECGYRECNVTVAGNRAKRVHYHDPDGFDKLMHKHWKAFYDELCTMPDPAIPVKEKKEEDEN
jgi:hypothetical protein